MSNDAAVDRLLLERTIPALDDAVGFWLPWSIRSASPRATSASTEPSRRRSPCAIGSRAAKRLPTLHTCQPTHSACQWSTDVQDDGQVEEARHGRHVGDIGDPEAVRRLRFEAPLDPIRCRPGLSPRPPKRIGVHETGAADSPAAAGEAFTFLRRPPAATIRLGPDQTEPSARSSRRVAARTRSTRSEPVRAAALTIRMNAPSAANATNAGSGRRAPASAGYGPAASLTRLF